MTEWMGRIDRREGTNAPVVLAHEIPFTLGPLMVEPALRRVSGTGREEILQPRTMQVLVCLARADGGIVSRDDLTMSCWGGVVVGDDAINRVIGQLRRVCEGIGDGRLAIETITKVGYRLIRAGPEACATGEEQAGTRSGEPVARLAAEPSPAGPETVAVGGSRRRKWAIIAAACLVPVTALAVAMGLHGFTARTSDPALVALDRFTSSGTGLPTDFAANIRNEVSAIRFGPAPMVLASDDPDQRRAGWRIAVDARGENGLVHVYAHLRRAGNEGEIWSPVMNVPQGEASAAEIGNLIGSVVKCLASADTRTGGQARAEVLVTYAKYCHANYAGLDYRRQVAALRDTVRADPEFVPAQEDLASFLAILSGRMGGAEGAAMRAEGQRAAETAHRLAPDAPGGWNALAFYVDNKEWAQREALLLKAVAAPMNGWPYAHQYHAHFLQQAGRLRDAIRAHERMLDLDNDNQFDRLRIAELHTMLGDYGQGQKEFAQEAMLAPGDRAIQRARLEAALDAHDWPTARDALARLPETRLTILQKSLVDALASGSQGSVDAVLARFDALDKRNRVEEVSRIEALALGSHPAEALAGLQAVFDRGDIDLLVLLYGPSFRVARDTADFTRLAEKTGLLAYWRTTGHEPDFCHEAGAPALCRGM